MVAWNFFTGASTGDQVQEQSACKLWFHFNKQKNDYLHSLDFSNCNNVSFWDKTSYATFT